MEVKVRRKRSLRTILFMAFLPVVIMPLLLVGALTNWRFGMEKRTVEHNIEEDLLQVATSRQNLLEGLIENAVDSAQIVAAAWPELRRAPHSAAVLESLRRRSHAFTKFWVVAPDGRVRFSSAPADVGRVIAGQPYWRDFLRSRTTTFSGFTSEADGRRVMRVVLPIQGGEALVATYDTAQLQNVFRNPMSVKLGRPSFIVDQSGRLVAHPDERVLAQNPDLSGLPPVSLALGGKAGTMVFRDPVSGQERSAAYLPLPKLGWALIAIQPSASTMLVSPAVANRDTILILAAGLLLAISATAMLSRLLAKPIERFGERLQSLTREEVRAERAELLASLDSGVVEYEQVRSSAKALYEALARNIAKLEAETNELTLTNQQQEVTVEALKRLDKLRGDFLNVLSHDLRIPLTSIMGYTELLQDAQDPPLGPDEQEYATQILEGCKRMQDMLEELLDYARLEVGRIKLHVESVEPRPIVEETVAFFRPLAAQKALTLSARLPGDLPDVMVDPDRLRQILNNLISNAIKYTPPGGVIVVRARAAEEEATFEVQDTGIGLTEEEKQHLFEKFYRSPRPEVQREKGSGLGLSIIKGVIEAHGGRIDFESQAGKGSTFRFTLPAQRVEAMAAAPVSERVPI